MKKFAKLALVAATAVMAASAQAQSVPYEKKAVNDNWGNGTSEYVWKNGTNELCWRDSSWTPLPPTPVRRRAGPGRCSGTGTGTGCSPGRLQREGHFRS